MLKVNIFDLYIMLGRDVYCKESIGLYHQYYQGDHHDHGDTGILLKCQINDTCSNTFYDDINKHRAILAKI